MSFYKSIFAILIFSFAASLTGAVAQTIAPPAPEQSPFSLAVTNAKKNMMSDPAAALEFAQQAEDEARATAFIDDEAIATSYWLQAEALNRLNKPDLAAPQIERALKRIGPDGRQTKLGGDIILAQGRIARVLSNDEIALKSFHEAHDIFAALGATRYQAITLQSLGSIYQDARDYPRVLEYYERAENVHPGDPALNLSSFNNRANAQRELGNYTQSIALSEQALELAQGFASPLLLARIHSNIASTMISANRFTDANKEIDLALTLMQTAQADQWRPLLLGVKAQAALGLGDTAAAQKYIEQTFAEQDLTKTTAPFKDFHHSAYNLYTDLGEWQSALTHLKAYKRLDDSARDIASSANNVLIAAEFDFTAQDLEIQKLESAELRNQIALTKSAAKQRDTLLLSVAGFVLIVSIALGWGLLLTHDSRKKIKLANKELETSNIALNKANKAKTEFLATTSHEIRTPLNGILGLTQIMLADETLPQCQLGYIQSIKGAGDTLLAVVNDILDVANIETGKFELTKGVTHMAKLAEDVMATFEETAKKKSVVLSLKTEDCPETVYSDSLRLRQLLFNLVSNAIKFTHSGTVNVEIKTHLRKGNEFYSVKVTDTGIGIPEDQLNKIFESFHQVDGRSTREYGGIGLGLAICKQISQALGGKISVNSTVGNGACFTVVLPLERLSTTVRTAAANNVDRQITELSQLDVLIVEDNILNRTVIKALIEKKVARVTLAEDGVEALTILKDHHFDLILMDKQMPNMDGLTATKMIRSMSDGTERTYIIAVTADAYDGAREELIDAGCDDYLSKPVNIDLLTEAMENGIACGMEHAAKITRAA